MFLIRGVDSVGVGLAKTPVIDASIRVWPRFGRNRINAVRTRANAKQSVGRHVPDDALLNRAHRQLDLSPIQQSLAWRQSLTPLYILLFSDI